MIRVPLGLKAGSLAYPSRFLLNCGFIHLKLITQFRLKQNSDLRICERRGREVVSRDRSWLLLNVTRISNTQIECQLFEIISNAVVLQEHLKDTWDSQNGTKLDIFRNQQE